MSGNIFFISDTHFGHKNILKYCNRPFDSIEEHDEALIQNWNEMVKPGDRIYHLGDFGFCSKTEHLERILKRLSGQKFFIRGNHDKQIKGNLLGYFEKVESLMELSVPDAEMDLKQKIVLCHYPIESWNKRHHGSWHLHGHCHGALPSADYQARVDVGVDVWDYRPVSYEEIKLHMTGKVFKPIDHHDGTRP